MDQVQRALHILDRDGVVGMPTETVYGLAARIDRPEALKKIFSTKERPFFDPLIVHVASFVQAQALAKEWSPIAQALADAFWPGPLTLVLEKQDHVSALITSGLSTVGIRFPRHLVARALIEGAGVPLAAPSANRFGRTSPTCRKHVLDEFGGLVEVLEGGDCEVGIESTILSVDKDLVCLLRPGQISKKQVEQVLLAKGCVFRWGESSDKTLAPGQMKHHYMPDRPLIIVPHALMPDRLIQLVSGHLRDLPDEVEHVKIRKPQKIEKIEWLILPENAAHAARELYQTLREASQRDADLLVLVWSAEKRVGSWEAVWDRLAKAASLILNEEEAI